MRILFLTEKAPALLSSMGIEDELDMELALILWCLKTNTVPEETACLN